VRITITARHVKVTDKMKDYAREKLKKLERYFDRISNINVILDHQGTDHICEINISTETHNQLSAIVRNQDDIHAAVDLCIDKSHRQLRKLKEKIKGHKGRDKRKKLGRDVKKLTRRLPEEETYEEAKRK
jgi:putative sigma-54 modulation protein